MRMVVEASEKVRAAWAGVSRGTPCTTGSIGQIHWKGPWRMVAANVGAPGMDGIRIEMIQEAAGGPEKLVAELNQHLILYGL